MDQSEKKIKALLILEIIGRPPEHVIATLNEIIGKINAEKGVTISNKKIKEPVLVKDQKDLYITFAEIEVELKEILYLPILIFKYMPSNIEIFEPEAITLNTAGWNDIFNEFTRRLHEYDEIARVLDFQNKELQEKLKELTPKEKESEKKEEKK